MHDGDRPDEHWEVLYVDGNGHGDYFCQIPHLHQQTLHLFDTRVYSPTFADNMYHFYHGLLSRLYDEVVCERFGTDLVANDCRVFDWLTQMRL